MGASDVCRALSMLVSIPQCERAHLDSALMLNLHQLNTFSSEGNSRVLATISSQLPAILTSSMTDREKHVSACLLLITCLRDELLSLREKDEHSSDQQSSLRLQSDALSVSQQQIVAGTLQFITALGIYPYLQSGVGVPLSLRLKESQLLGLTSGTGTGVSCQSEAAKDTEYAMNRLIQTVLVLTKCLDHPGLGSIVLSRHLTDLLASLLQICHSPTYEDVTEMLRRERCVDALGNLMDRTYQPLVIRELLLLQGRPPRSSKKLSREQADGSSSVAKGMPVAVTPKWLRDVCGRYLSERLMRNKGVQAVILALTDIPGLSSDLLWKQCEMVAKLIANCPQQAESVEIYYGKICPQILDLLTQLKQDSLNLAFLQVATSTISAVYERNQSLAWELLLWPIIQPLFYMLNDSHVHSTCGVSVALGDNWLLATENQVTQCVEVLHKMFTRCRCLSPSVVHALSLVLPAVVRLKCSAMRSVSHLRTLTHEIVDSFMRQAECELAVTVLCQSFMPYGVFVSKTAGGHVTSCLDVFNNDVALVRGPSSGFMVVNTSIQGEQPGICVPIERDFRIDCDCLMEAVKDATCASLFLEILFEELGAMLCSRLSRGVDQPLLVLEDTTGGSRRQHALIVMNYIAALCEDLSQEVLGRPAPVLDFLFASFSQSAKELSCQEPGLACEMLTLAVGLTSALLSTEQKNLKPFRSQFMSLVPHLEVLSKNHPDPNTRDLLCDLHIAVATHGAVWSGLSKQRSKQGNGEIGKGTEDNSCEDNGVNSPFSDAMKELLDPLLPVRAHALRQLTSLVQSRHPEATSNSEKLLLIFRKQLEHSDSYIYLAAINGLVALGDKYPDQVVDILCREFALFYGNPAEKNECKTKGLMKPAMPLGVKPELTADLRMKLGEALVKLSEALGEMLPHYREPLLSALLCSVKDCDELVRASSLSNLGTVCKQLQFAFGAVVHEVLGCVTAVVSHDSSARVRRAAVLVLEMMFKGLGKASLEVIPDRMGDVYHLLKQVHSSDNDELTRTHAGAALGELDTIMRQCLFPSQELRKKITVLDEL